MAKASFECNPPDKPGGKPVIDDPAATPTKLPAVPDTTVAPVLVTVLAPRTPNEAAFAKSIRVAATEIDGGKTTYTPTIRAKVAVIRLKILFIVSLFQMHTAGANPR